ncbi:ABC transporter ATP-binding protein [Sporosarcina limicola]|uniref:Oligopeptide transport system ATP-binding protein n=1 Tax=Sporosarcina limicola TaxID=34101 RepID=A0A927ME49_9BACL|nr:ABC transporter ATP-binding protein [Sporosarcina limicola]MBE1552968.1 oligopeptide transport system ATP-binding protein [Sporosarcina limicola]
MNQEMKDDSILLKVNHLQTSFFTHFGEVKAVRDVDLTINKGEVVGVVGESGSGKSVTAMSILKLLQHPGKIISGNIIYKGQDLAQRSEKEMRKIRGNEISMIFQDPMTSLNPLITVGEQIMETIIEHQPLNKKQAKEKAINLLNMVKIPDAEKRMKDYPFEFSGGMRQRVMIAIALSCEPDLLIADEPTTALDVTTQSQILKLMKNLKGEFNTSIMLITHDLGVVADICSRIVVMYGGMIMEEGSVEDIFYRSKHPYTLGLLKSVPRPDMDQQSRLEPIKGTPPNLVNPPEGCPFAPRCDYAMKICTTTCPEHTYIQEGHRSMCWLLHEEAPKSDFLSEGDELYE